MIRTVYNNSQNKPTISKHPPPNETPLSKSFSKRKRKYSTPCILL